MDVDGGIEDDDDDDGGFGLDDEVCFCHLWLFHFPRSQLMKKPPIRSSAA
jgi:hypothetical protein